jgi:hypothetical protein
VISDFRRDVDEIYGLLGYYTALSGSCVPIGCPEISTENQHSTLRNNPEEGRAHLILLLFIKYIYYA